jgi:hypothetical protein
MARKGDGKGGTHKAGVAEKPAQKERIVRVKKDVDEHLDRLGKSKDWRVKTKNGEKIYTHKKTGEERWGDYLHNEIECNKNGKPYVIDPVTEKVLDKKGHLRKSK